MSMEIKLPARYQDLKLRHLIVLQSVQDPVERIAKITERPATDLLSLPMTLLDRATTHLNTLLDTEVTLHPKRVSMDGKSYGFIPDWSEFTTGEWIDMERYTQDIWSNAHRIMSLLYRPITDQIGERYEIQPYSSKEDPDLWLDCPASWFSGALLFFSTSRERLLSSINQSLREVTEDQIKSARSGDGTTSSFIWRGLMSSVWTRSRNYLFRYASNTSPIYKTFRK